MKNLTHTCIALAVLMGTTATIHAQNGNRSQRVSQGNHSQAERQNGRTNSNWHRGGNRNNGGRGQRGREVYEVTVEIEKFRGYKFVRGGDNKPKNLNYTVNFAIDLDGQRFAGSENINNAVRMKYIRIGNRNRRVFTNVDPNAKMTLRVSGKVAGQRAAGIQTQTVNISPNGTTVWMNGSDFQVAVKYTVVKKRAR